MTAPGTPTASVRLDATCRRIEEWRKTRRHRNEPMPAVLWQAAVAAAQEHGLGIAARSLHVDYGALKKHVDATVKPPNKPVFVEVGQNGSCSAPCVIEVDGPGGTLRIRLAAVGLQEITALIRVWGSR